MKPSTEFQLLAHEALSSKSRKAVLKQQSSRVCLLVVTSIESKGIPTFQYMYIYKSL